MFTKQEKLLFKSQSSDHLKVHNEEKETNKSANSLKFLPIAQFKKGEIPDKLNEKTQLRMSEEATLLLKMDVKREMQKKLIMGLFYC